MPWINKPPRKPKKQSTSEKRKEIEGYYQSREWRKLRLLKLQENPICQLCKKELANEVHHIDSIWKYNTPEERKQKALYVDLCDLLSLCNKCHTDLHAKLHTKKFI